MRLCSQIRPLLGISKSGGPRAAKAESSQAGQSNSQSCQDPRRPAARAWSRPKTDKVQCGKDLYSTLNHAVGRRFLRGLTLGEADAINLILHHFTTTLRRDRLTAAHIPARLQLYDYNQRSV